MGIECDNNYWISWWHNEKYGPFELHSPWWVSGERGEDEHTEWSVCAAIKAKNEHDARSIILKCYDSLPDDLEFRFCTEFAQDKSPFSERFPKAEWMKW